MQHFRYLSMLCLTWLLITAAAAAQVPPTESQDPHGAASLRAAIEDWMALFPDREARGREYLARLQQLVSDLKRASGDQADRLAAELATLRRAALAAHPLVGDRPLLFVVRPQYRKDHHNTATMFQTGEINTGSFQGGGALKTIDLATGTVTTLLDVPDGIVRDPDVSFDGTQILFSMRRNREDDYHIYEINADGSGLRQITFGSGLSDIDPIYLPDERILFTSTREPKYCMCNRHIMGNLFTMDADGSNVQQIGRSTLHEGHAALLPDGRIIYDRWEYVDRNFGDAQGVWSCSPDGTNHAVYWGNNTNSPGAVLDARVIPGTELMLANFSSCHDRPWGALAIVDRRLGLDGRTPVLQTWPADAIELVGKGNYDTFVRVDPKYEDPYPLSDKVFLCSRMTGRGEETGIYLLDTFGNEVPLYVEAPGCFDPMPLGPRPRPPVIPSRIDLSKTEGYFYIENVYVGTGMETVEPDGSAYVAVPADTFVYFQLLDERGMMVQSMRSGTIVRPGETSGCVGCHEPRRSSAQWQNAGTAWQQGPRKLEPWYGPPRLFSYTAEVQPVFDRHCTSCHDYGQEAGQKLNLAGDLGLVFNTSYTELRSKGLIQVVGAGPFQVQKPKSWGSHASRLAKVLRDGHGDAEIDAKVKLDPESFDRLVTWIDINAPYYPDYAGGAYRDNPFGRAPLKNGELKRLNELTGLNLLDRGQLTQVSFTRPESSPCLIPLGGPDDARYQESLAIVRAGQARLAAEPRPDMPGFRIEDPVERKQQEKYQAQAAQESRIRAAMAGGER